MKFSGLKISFRSRIVVIAIGVVLAALSLVYTYKLADILRQKEQNDVNLWVAAMERVHIRKIKGKSKRFPLFVILFSSPDPDGSPARYRK